MTGPIAYYIHHHGDGHRQRALAVARQAPQRFVLIGTGLKGKTGGLNYLDLPDDGPAGRPDFDGADRCPERPHALHYAPLHHDGVRARVAQLAEWIARERPALMVVDVSVEIAMLARLAATPTVYVRLAGARNDRAHLDAFRGACALLAPFHQELDDTTIVGWARDKTRYFPGLCGASASAPPTADSILTVYGKGGALGDGDALANAARATPQWRWRAIGPVSRPNDPARNLTILGWIDNVAEEIANAAVVVGAAGDGLVNAVIAAGRPFICIPEPRPFDEQTAKAKRLAALGAAVAVDRRPLPAEWPDLLARARNLQPEAMLRLHDPHGPRQAANFLIETARRSVPCHEH